MATTLAAAPQRHRRRALKQQNLRRAVEPWLYLAPALVLLGCVLLVPLVVGVGFSLRHFSAFRSEYVGLSQYARMLHDPVLGEALRNTVWWTVASLALQFGLGLGLAMLLNRAFRGRSVVQALVFLPWAVPTFLAGLTWAWLLNPVIGPLPRWMAAVGIGTPQTSILSDPATAMWGPITANVWFGIPFFAITILAALKTIPAELYEAAAIDGASGWDRFAQITLPFLTPTIAITVMLRTIWIATFADLIFVMTHGGPAGSTNTVATYVYVTAFTSLDKGYASAVSILLLALLVAYALALIRLRRRYA